MSMFQTGGGTPLLMHRQNKLHSKRPSQRVQVQHQPVGHLPQIELARNHDCISQSLTDILLYIKGSVRNICEN